VDIGTPLGDLKAIKTFGGILTQANIIMTLDGDRRNLRLADVIIAPDLGDRTTLDFSGIDAVIELGYKGAEAKAAILEKFSIDQSEWQQHVAGQKARILTGAPIPVEIMVAGVPDRAQRTIKSQLKKFVGNQLNTEQLEAALTRFTGEGKYESLDYRITRSSSDPSKSALLILVKEKPYAPPTLDFSLALDGSDIDDIHFSIGSRLTLYDVGKQGSEWRNDIRIGYRALLASEYVYPIGKNGLFVAPRAYFARGIENLFTSEGSRVADYQVNRSGVGVDLGYLTRRGEFRTGYEIGRFNADVRAGSPPITSVSGKVSLTRMRWSYDATDSATVPSRGFRVTAEGRWVFDAPLMTTAFPQAEVTMLMVKPLSRRGSVFVSNQLGTTFNKDAPAEMMFTLGGPFRLGAYDLEQFRGNHYFMSSLGYRHHISELSPLLGGKIYTIAWFDAGGAYMDFTSPIVQYQGSAGFIMDTKLGPLALIGALGKGGQGKVYFSFGKFF
jgi:NTE family protein